MLTNLTENVQNNVLSKSLNKKDLPCNQQHSGEIQLYKDISVSDTTQQGSSTCEQNIALDVFSDFYLKHLPTH